jgi:hypothetical protein
VEALGGKALPRGEKRRYVTECVALALLGGIGYVCGLLDVHYRWTDYADVWKMLGMGLWSSLLLIGVMIVLAKWQNWMYARQKARKERRP